MEQEVFDWYDIDNDPEDDNIREVKHKKSYVSIVFDFLSATSLYVFLISLFNYGFFIIFEYEKLPFIEADIKNINRIVLVFLGIFRILILLMSVIAIILNIGHANRLMRYFDKTYRLVVFEIFILIIYAYLNINTQDEYYVGLKRLLFTLNFSMVFYILFTCCVVCLEDKFVETTLEQKILNTEDTEKILKLLKLYLNNFEHDCSCDDEADHYRFKDLFSFNINYQTLLELIETDPGTEIENFNIKISNPVIGQHMDAIELAKAVFLKASSDDERMSFDEFKTIFQNSETAENIYTFFDLNGDTSISRKEFRDTILYFYMNRVSLENSIEAVSHFTVVIKRVLYTIGFMALIIIDLILFGVNIKEIFALVVSLGIAANFIGNKLFQEAWKSIIVLMSHQFDVGDTITIDNKQMVVYDVGIATSSFILENGGKYKVLNSDLWKKPIINLTNAPEKIMLFEFNLPVNITLGQIHDLKTHIKIFLQRKSFDFHSDFVLGSTVNDRYEINRLNATITLRCKNYKSSSKKFLLRVEFTDFLNNYLKNIVD